ncbi:hypothetical protein [Aestuariicoccus sp. MJ-SS9]|uniref:hypothetical protein n=1 Tax=Aestuariicoccus sp. MJ-SS9 TaxID=3079855 RepID=UPI002912D40B|nr:hypothetical protein [Aestuariicoccus sp. MJ-SS9]MDU8911539.1 hypothetical protein [Aestuariicoccus sp. MJ-SS9]
MDLRKKKKELVGLVGGIGVVVALGGFVGGWYSPGTTIVATFGVWIVGTLLVNLFCD